jgi:hypothetical protein
MHIIGDMLTRPYQHGAEDILGRPSLMGGDKVLETEYLLDGLL